MSMKVKNKNLADFLCAKRMVQFLVLCLVLASCSPASERTSVDVLHSSGYYWELVHPEFFSDGGSVALGLLNSNGELIFLWAHSTWDKPGKQKLYLKLNYNDPNSIEIIEDSDLERAISTILESIVIRPYLDDFIPLVDAFKSVLSDRCDQVPRL